jgi:7-carboxy-7-deazaguanine synthase
MTASPADTVQVTEIFHSIQGESSHAGKPCIFVRLTGCGLRCTYCDTPYSFGGGQEMTVNQVLTEASRHPTRLVEITGGEPMEQAGVYPLINSFLTAGYTVMLETGGHVLLADVPSAVIKIIDVKCPGSNEGGTFIGRNLETATSHDEFKFVISSRQDYEWSRQFYRQHLIRKPNTVLFSPAHDLLSAQKLSEWVLSDSLDVRIQLQIHKYIWGAEARGV